MKHSFGVCGGETSTKLTRRFHGLVLRQAADAPEQGGQVFSVDVLHGEERLTVNLTNVVYAAYVGM